MQPVSLFAVKLWGKVMHDGKVVTVLRRMTLRYTCVIRDHCVLTTKYVLTWEIVAGDVAQRSGTRMIGDSSETTVPTDIKTPHKTYVIYPTTLPTYPTFDLCL